MELSQEQKNYRDSDFRDIAILYVEDDEFLRENVMEFLKMRFSRVFSAGDGEEGLDVFRMKSPDLVITDIKMPVMDGLEMTEWIKSISPGTPVIVTTALAIPAHFLMASISRGSMMRSLG